MRTSLLDRGGLAVRPRTLHWAERLFAFVTISAVAMNWPWVWLNRGSSVDLTTVDTRGTVLFLTLFLGAAVMLVIHWSHLMSIVKGEPALTALLLLAVSSVLWADSPDLTLRRSIALALSAAFGAYLVVRFPLPSILRMVAWVVLLRVLIDYALIFGVPSVGVEPGGLWQGRAFGKNALGRDAVMATLLLVWQAIGFSRGRFLFLGGAVLAFGLILGSQSTTALVSAMLLLAAIPAYQLLRARKTLFGAVILSVGGGSILAASIALSQLAVITNALGKDVTLTGRTTLWTESIKAIAERPLLGWGYSSFWTGWFGPNHDVWTALGTFRSPHSHNGLIDVVLDLGIVGGLLYSTVLARGLVRAVRFCRIHTGVVGMFPLAFLALAVLASSTEHGLMAQNSLLWVLFIVTICVLTSVKGEQAPEISRKRPESRVMPDTSHEGPVGAHSARALRISQRI